MMPTILRNEVPSGPERQMLYDIYAFECVGEVPTVTQVTMGSGMPQTTALRHLEHLYRLGLVERRADAIDRRKRLLQLSREAQSLVEASLLQEFRSLQRIIA